MDALGLCTALILPLTDMRFVARAHERGADAIVLDLEDGVPPACKDAARRALPEAVSQLHRAGAAVMVRVNRDAPTLADDLSATVQAGIEHVLLPKVEAVSDLHDIEPVAAMVEGRQRLAKGTVRIFAIIESPHAVLAAADIARHPRVAALLFGSEDYCAALGVSSSVAELDWPAYQIALAARAAGRAAFGLPGSIANLDDMDRLESQARRGRRMGFTGCMCIHPRQIAAVTRAFVPSDDELAFARAVVAAADDSEYRDRGVISVHGRMIDAPVVTQARATVRRAAAGAR